MNDCILFHSPMSTCSQKVRLVLAEKEERFDSRVLDLRAGEALLPDYLALNPAGVVPTLIHADTVLTESTLICHYLDDRFIPGSLTPADPRARDAMRRWLRRLDGEIHADVGNLTFAIAGRHWYLDRPGERDRYLSAIPDPVRRDRRRIALDEGCGSAQFRASLARVRLVLADLNRAVADRPWLAGEDVSIADLAYLPYVQRVEHLALESLLEPLGALRRWLERSRARPACATAVDAWLQPAAVANMHQLGEHARETVDLSAA